MRVALVAAVWSAVAGQIQGREFAYLSYDEIVSELYALEEKFPDVMHVTTANAAYGIGTYGMCGEEACEIHIVRVTNAATFSKDRERPEIYFSGELHGDERVGPIATLEFIRLLVTEYNKDPWITRLVDTRAVYLTPMTNAHGYYHKQRREGVVDVNRDFPIDDPEIGCMRSIAARAINELFRDHLFQISVTFHGGIDLIGYVWGTASTYYSNHNSPDAKSLDMLGSTMSAYGGKVDNANYPHGPMNQVIYPVRGGMEDWSYATSWNSKHSRSSCKKVDGYKSSRTKYKSKDLRVLTFLVETSKSKAPSEETLGSDEGLFDPQGAGQGHVPRNVRLMLFLTDIVQPYVHIVSVDGANRSISWEVGGSTFVDETYIKYQYKTSAGRKQKKISEKLSGSTRWGPSKSEEVAKHQAGLDIDLDANTVDRKLHPFVSAFEMQVSLPPGATLLSFQVFAKVDQQWSENGSTFPSLDPQSHLVNARTKKKWRVSKNGRQIKGHTLWSSNKVCFDRETQLREDC